MRTITAWLGSIATVVLSVMIAQRVVWGTYDWVWGVVGGVAVVLLAVIALALTIGSAEEPQEVRLLNGSAKSRAGITARVVARAVDLLVMTPGISLVLRDIYRHFDASSNAS